MASRPLAWTLVAAAGLAALVLARPAAAPAESAPPARPAAAPTPVLQMMGLAAPTAPAQAEAHAPDDTVQQAWLARRDFAQALAALQRAPLEAAMRERLLQELLDRWAETAPEQAARWARDTPAQAARLPVLLDRWLQHDARSATVFASTLPAGEPRQAMLDEALLRWTAQDGAAARDWLRSYAPRPDLDAAIARHASSDELARYAPAEALDLVSRIATPERRWQAWQALARSLHDIDPGQAEALLSGAPGLWPAERAQLLAELH